MKLKLLRPRENHLSKFGSNNLKRKDILFFFRMDGQTGKEMEEWK